MEAFSIFLQNSERLKAQNKVLAQRAERAATEAARVQVEQVRTERAKLYVAYRLKISLNIGHCAQNTSMV